MTGMGEAKRRAARRPETAVSSLPDQYHAYVASTVTDEGVRLWPMLVRDREGKLEIFAMDLPPADAYRLVVATSRKPETDELIYGLDRFTQPGQGTEFADCLAGAWFVRGAWRPFVINYRHEPRVVRPFDWRNAHWIEAVRRELSQLGVPPGAVAPLPDA